MTNLVLPSVDASSNRFTTGQGYTYDKDGNITADPESSGRTFVFNGDNKQTQVKDSTGATIGTYYYDGNGHRIKKITNLETTVFVYDGLGKLIAEYSSVAPPSSPTTNYTATDNLGSPRVLTDSYGQVQSRRDFMPFGEEIYADNSNRLTGYKYSTSSQDSVRQRYTGYQKDAETGLDFAEARYFNEQHGRFTAIDPLLTSAKQENPQSFDRYLYVTNRPLLLTDATGLQSGRKTEKSDNDNDVIKVYTTEPRIVSVSTKLLNKTIYGDVPVGGRFQITYSFIVNADDTGERKPEDMGQIESVPIRKSNGQINEAETKPGTLADVGLEKVEPDKVETTPNGKDEGFKVTKTETFMVKDLPERRGKDFSTAINYQVVVRDPSGKVVRYNTTDRDKMKNEVEISNAPEDKKKKNNEEE